MCHHEEALVEMEKTWLSSWREGVAVADGFQAKVLPLATLIQLFVRLVVLITMHLSDFQPISPCNRLFGFGAPSISSYGKKWINIRTAEFASTDPLFDELIFGTASMIVGVRYKNLDIVSDS
ncbi:hypothetical protein RJT34_04082 [Clitoria ternatea]|uniref:Uncharacterized protein n=1 Tax=Clitoria ternatea TaxID=43366 RepID=A0AAN9KKZ0_CLITE